jgi:hypothetical protein
MPKQTVGGGLGIGKCMGTSYPCGSQVWVFAGMGMGKCSKTCQLQNKLKDIKNEGDMVKTVEI